MKLRRENTPFGYTKNKEFAISWYASDDSVPYFAIFVEYSEIIFWAMSCRRTRRNQKYQKALSPWTNCGLVYFKQFHVKHRSIDRSNRKWKKKIDEHLAQFRCAFLAVYIHLFGIARVSHLTANCHQLALLQPVLSSRIARCGQSRCQSNWNSNSTQLLGSPHIHRRQQLACSYKSFVPDISPIIWPSFHFCRWCHGICVSLHNANATTCVARA